MRLVDELAKARGEKTQEEKMLEAREKELQQEIEFRETIKKRI